MSTANKKLERQVRIELLRTRAELERKELCYITRELSSQLKPMNLIDLLKGQVVQGVSSSFGAGSKTGQWVNFALTLGRRYPLVFSGVSMLAGTIVRRKGWRLGAMALTTWRLLNVYQEHQQKKKDSYIQPEHPDSRRIIGPF